MDERLFETIKVFFDMDFKKYVWLRTTTSVKIMEEFLDKDHIITDGIGISSPLLNTWKSYKR